jgi:hypothetical protein
MDNESTGLVPRIVDKAAALNKALLGACWALSIALAATECPAAAEAPAACDFKATPAGPMSAVLGVPGAWIGMVRITSLCPVAVEASVSHAIYRHGTTELAQGFEFSPVSASVTLPVGKAQRDLPFSLIARSATPGRYDVHVIVRAAGQDKHAIFDDVVM